MTKSSFTHNRASRGGVIYLPTGVHLAVDYSSFLNNLANIDGGAVYSERNNSLIINSSTINDNEAKNDGGAVCLFLSDLVIGGDSSDFFGNQAHRGGVVYASESKIDVYIENSITIGTEFGKDISLYLSSANITFFSAITSESPIVPIGGNSSEVNSNISGLPFTTPEGCLNFV